MIHYQFNKGRPNFRFNAIVTWKWKILTKANRPNETSFKRETAEVNGLSSSYDLFEQEAIHMHFGVHSHDFVCQY